MTRVPKKRKHRITFPMKRNIWIFFERIQWKKQNLETPYCDGKMEGSKSRRNLKILSDRIN